VSWPVAHAAFVAHVAPRLAEPLPAVEVLGIDETRRGKPVWAKDPVTGRWRLAADCWHTGIVDAAGTAGLLAHVDGRTAATVAEWVGAQPEPWRAGIKYVCMDLSASYLKAVTTALPDAVVVADRFHLVRLANDMLTELRQRVTREDRGRRGRNEGPRMGLPAAAAHRTRTTHPRHVRADVERAGRPRRPRHRDPARLRRQGEPAPAAGPPPTPGTSTPDRSVISHRLWRLLDLAAATDSPEVHRLAATIEAWWPTVEAAIVTGHSNARSEGYNRLAKHEGRNAFGFRNTTNQRRRIRWACTRQHRRASAKISEMPGQVR